MTGVNPEVIGQIILLQPSQIDAEDRLLPLDPVWVEALSAMMKADGQLTPIEVCRLPGHSDYKLVTGGHRHAAAVKNGMQLRAEVITSDASERRLREASENVKRRDLAPIDRAKSIAELVAVQKVAAGLTPDQDGRSVSAHARWQKRLQDEVDDATEIFSVAYGWVEEVGEAAGLTGRSIRNDLSLLRGIPASIAEALRRADHASWWNASQLKALAGLEPIEQQKVLGLLIHADAKIAGAPFDKVTDAIAAMRGRIPPAPSDKRLNAFTGSFSRMPLSEQRGALAELRHHLPKGWRLEEGDASSVKASFSAEHVRYREEALSVIDEVRGLIDGLLEDEVLDGERHSALDRAVGDLAVTRLTIAGNGFSMEGEA